MKILSSMFLVLLFSLDVYSGDLTKSEILGTWENISVNNKGIIGFGKRHTITFDKDGKYILQTTKYGRQPDGNVKQGKKFINTKTGSWDVRNGELIFDYGSYYRTVKTTKNIFGIIHIRLNISDMQCFFQQE